MTLLIWEYGGALPPPEKRIYDISSGIVCESDNYLSNIHNPGQTSRKLSSGSTLLDRVIPNPIFITINPALTPSPSPKLGRGEPEPEAKAG
jgi:hypothetical protein